MNAQNFSTKVLNERAEYGHQSSVQAKYNNYGSCVDDASEMLTIKSAGRNTNYENNLNGSKLNNHRS